MSDHVVRLTVNGRDYAEEVPARMTLADLLRERLDLTGTHLGCEHGVCGACTVLIDGEAARSCTTLAVQADGVHVRTVEGLAPGDALHPLQEAFWERHGLQCGFCTPGILMSLVDLFETEPVVDRELLMETLGGCLCRCTGYVNIVAAAEDAARRLGLMDDAGE
jgi:carbon-monoxide dehydrogenase small subunit